MTHRELCFSLAEAKGSYYVEIPLGSVWLSQKGMGIADVVTVKPSYTKFNIDIYECKVSRADAMGDIKSGKYEKYFPHCNRLYFATEGKLIAPQELPAGVGLVVKGENGWHTVKMAKPRNIEVPSETLLSLLFFRGRVHNKRRTDLKNARYLDISALAESKGSLKVMGKKVHQALIDYPKILSDYNNLRHATKGFVPENRWDRMTMENLKEYDYL